MGQGAWGWGRLGRPVTRARLQIRLRAIFCNCSLRSGECFQGVMVFQVLFSTFSLDLSLVALKNTPQGTGNGCRKSHEILSIFMQQEPITRPGCIKPLSAHLQ